MNTDVLPTFERHSARIATVLNDIGREFRGRPGRNPYELFLRLDEIEHRTTRVTRPQSNGIVERLCRVLLDEYFRVMRRKKFYETLEETQADQETYPRTHNHNRLRQGRDMKGRTPVKAFTPGLPKKENPAKMEKRKAA